MAFRYQLIDDVTGKKVRGGVAASATGAPYVVELFVVSNALGQTVFTLSNTINVTTTIEVLLNGVELDEGAGNDFTRDTNANTVEFNYTIPKNAKVKVKIYS
jgi:hypothetical protein